MRKRLPSSELRAGAGDSGSADCGETQFTGNDGVIHSPNYPNVYPHSSQCEWTITSPREDDKINITFIAFDMEAGSNLLSCKYDFLEVGAFRLTSYFIFFIAVLNLILNYRDRTKIAVNKLMYNVLWHQFKKVVMDHIKCRGYI